MSWGSAAEGAASAGSTAGEAAASSAGSAAGGAAGGMGSVGGAGMMQSSTGAFPSSAGSGVLQSSAGSAPSMGSEMWGSVPPASSGGGGGGMWDSVVSAVKDYNKGESMDLGDAIESAMDKKYAKLAGYIGGKVQGAGGAGMPTPLINLPSVGPQDNTMQDRYSNLYKLYSRRV